MERRGGGGWRLGREVEGGGKGEEVWLCRRGGERLGATQSPSNIKI